MGKYLIKNLPICRSRREGEPNKIPDREQLTAIHRNFNPNELQVPITPHLGFENDLPAQGWVNSLSLVEDGGDLWLVLDEAVVFDWLAYELREGMRGPRSITWMENPYRQGPQLMHLAFIGSQNPAAYGLEPFDPKTHLLAIAREESELEPASAFTYLSKPPAGTVHKCEYEPVVPSTCEVTHDESEVTEMPITEQEHNELKAKFEKMEAGTKELTEKLKKAEDEKFQLALDGILATVPEGTRKEISETAMLMKESNPDGALELAKKLAKQLKPVVPEGLGNRLSVPTNDQNHNNDGLTPLEAYNLSVAQDFKKAKSA